MLSSDGGFCSAKLYDLPFFANAIFCTFQLWQYCINICAAIIYEITKHFLMNWGYRYLHDEEITLHPSDTTTVNVAGKVYSDVLMINDTVSSNVYEDENNCEYFIWSKSKGLLQYKYINGEVYTFYKKLPYKKKGWFQ